jgi:hypothetical protein
VNDIRVVPNRLLGIYLESEVVRRAEAKSIKLRQKPDAQIKSGETTYIARVASQTTALPPPDLSLTRDVRDIASRRLFRAGADIGLRAGLAANGIDDQTAVASFTKVEDAVLKASADAYNGARLSGPVVASAEAFASVAVSGADISEVIAGPNISAERYPTPTTAAEASMARIRLNDRPAASIILRFRDGTGTVIAALRGFVCSIVVDSTGVSSVNYLRIGQRRDERIAKLNAAVVAAAQLGVFRIEGDRETAATKAARFGDQIRVGKSTDPSLGLYAAYAYAQANLIEKVRSVGDFMRNDLHTDLFDIAMLGRESSTDTTPVFPFCPMLAQGWGLLRVMEAQIAPEVDRARDHLRASLWTTFDSFGLDIVSNALRRGRLQ